VRGRVAAAFVAAVVFPTGVFAGGVLRLCLHGEPETLDPLRVADESSELVRYLTGAVLIRVNRLTQQFEPELAEGWKALDGGKQIRFRLRVGVRFSDGSPLDSQDVVCTFGRLLSPELHSPTADSFRSAGSPIRVTALSAYEVAVQFPRPVAGWERLFDQVPICACEDPTAERAVLGPFRIAERRPGRYIRLERNPYYWKRDPQGRQLPYLDGIQLEIQSNRQLEAARYLRGELHLMQKVDPEVFEQLERRRARILYDGGPGLDAELLWFNQAPHAPIPPYKRKWFSSTAFRRAISEAISREDLCRVVYRGRATPAAGPVSPANLFWFNSKLRPHPYDPEGAVQRLAAAGFQLRHGQLFDSEGHPVEFSLVTNAGNRARERMAALIQQDLARIGIRVQIVTLEFRSLIERITQTLSYEACLLGLTNVDLDPNSQMNLWLSSGANHQWNPKQKQPATDWEAEMDRLMLQQASSIDARARKVAFDRVQEIVHEQAPFIYLVYKNVLCAYSPSVRNVKPARLHPELVWNIEWLDLASP